eukprot:NODE_25997_length_568_cov_2.582766.p1 GENE.NODE_25997_length_568_cov_2.582766~~NODE_25997_length_568_cov_2.582766.p1  ORF type:complete len:76 (-),score=26.62 NODE_25997_length_568_cov_2.582766:62-289(-)
MDAVDTVSVLSALDREAPARRLSTPSVLKCLGCGKKKKKKKKKNSGWKPVTYKKKTKQKKKKKVKKKIAEKLQRK